MKAVVSIRLSPSRLCMLRNDGATGLAPTMLRRSFTSSGSNLATWGFIGLGRMGYPMAKNLRARIPNDDKLLVFDRDSEATSKFAKEVGIAASSVGAESKGTGIEIVNSPREVAERSETIITVLPESSHVKNVFHNILEPSLTPATPERLFIDCSTIDPISSREVANAVHCTKQGRFVDAPMSGGVVGARAATLTFMLGASSRSGQLVERVTPILELMGSKVVHLGEQGMGLSAKLANNYLLAISNIATAEAMNMGLRSGLDAAKLGQLINSSSGRCWSSEVNNPVPGISPRSPAQDDFQGGFGIGLMRKDLALAIDAAMKAGVRLALAQKASEVYEDVEAKHAGRDLSVVYKWLVEENPDQ